jgi:kumamolisin
MAKALRKGGAAAKSNFQHVHKNSVHPYIKWPRTAAQAKPWKIPSLLTAYDWPKGTAPGGGAIAIIELGGGWIQSDIDTFFTNAGLPAPHITDISVDDTANSQCNPRNQADGEVALDIQVAGAAYAAASGQAATIRVYWSRDITQAIIAATNDGCDVCSISWGADEASWGQQAGLALE